MNPVATLIRPRFLSFRNGGLENKGGLRLLFFAGIGLLFWVGIYGVSHRVLIYFQQVEDFGDILAYKLLSMVLLTFFSLLIFSSILTSLSKLYMSKDLSLVHAMPVSSGTIFFLGGPETPWNAPGLSAFSPSPVSFTYAPDMAQGPSFS